MQHAALSLSPQHGASHLLSTRPAVSLVQPLVQVWTLWWLSHKERKNPSKDTAQPRAHCVGCRAASLGQSSPSCAAELHSQNKQQNKKTEKKKNTKPTTTEQPHSRRALRRARLICSDLSTSYREKSAGERFPLQALRWGTMLLSAAFVSQWGLLQHTPAPLQPHISAVWCLRYNPS